MHFLLAALWLALPGRGADLESGLRALNPAVVSAGDSLGISLPRMLGEDVGRRIRAANERETDAWRAIRNAGEWERYRDSRIAALRASLGVFPQPAGTPDVRITGRLEGEGYRIENLVFESRPGLLVTANLYMPAKPAASMPGILLIHSHHNPKTQGELQDMGILWARSGCCVLVMDQLGHGERRTHPFMDASSYPGTFRPGRQDYYFRYNTAAQLHLVGESLIGWMAWDVMRGVDLLLSRPGVDRERILLLGSVAGGGDPAGVTAALDPRIACVVPFNFGGPQPETAYPLPQDAESEFNYAGSGSWESTRNLRLSARDGFLPWVIVASVAPRYLVHAHEFAWDRERDPVWKRYLRIFELYGRPERLAAVHGGGSVRGQPPESTHCNNIGAVHRQAGIYSAFARWFRIPLPEREPEERRPAEDLKCLIPGIRMRPLHELASRLGARRLEEARKDPGLQAVRRRWLRLLGDVEPAPSYRVADLGTDRIADVLGHRLRIDAGDITIPLILLVPPRGAKRPVVVAIAWEGKAGFLEHRAREIAGLLTGGAAVCLVDLRGTGESRPGDSVDRAGELTSIASGELMLGQTLLGSRLKDLRTVLAYLRQRADLDGTRVALWGESFAPANPRGSRLDVPLDAKLPGFSQPAGAMTALFGMLVDEELRGAWGRGGLASFASILRSPFIYVPQDAVIPGALSAGDLPDVAAALAPRPVRLVESVDGLNRRVAATAGESSPVQWLLRLLRR